MSRRLHHCPLESSSSRLPIGHATIRHVAAPGCAKEPRWKDRVVFALASLAAILTPTMACQKSSSNRSEAQEAPQPIEEPARKTSPTPRKIAPESKSAPVEDEQQREKALRELFEAWLQAQNQGNFERYRASYAERMTGIKRSGERVRRYDRNHWLQDRARMFRKPMKVDASSVSIVSTTRSAKITFIQSWASGNYSDRGPKELQLQRGGDTDAWLIVKEEMLRSEVAGRVEPINPAQSLWDRYRLLPLLDASAALALWPHSSTEKPAENSNPGELKLWSRSPAIAGHFSPDLAWPAHGEKDATLQVLDQGGDFHSGEPGAAIQVAAYIPHFGTQAQWLGEEETPAPDDASVAHEIWSIAGDQAGPGAVVKTSASKPRWAFFNENKEHSIYPHHRLDAKNTASLRDVFFQSATAKVLQTMHRREFDGKKPWWQRDDAQESIVAYQDPASEARFAFIVVQAGEGCGDFIALGWALLRQAKLGDAWVLLAEGSGDPINELPKVDIAIDFDGDHWPEFLSLERDHGFALTRQGGSYRGQFVINLPSHDCPC